MEASFSFLSLSLFPLLFFVLLLLHWPKLLVLGSLLRSPVSSASPSAEVDEALRKGGAGADSSSSSSSSSSLASAAAADRRVGRRSSCRHT